MRRSIHHIAAASALAYAALAQAHHSFAAFDPGKQQTLKGVVQEFQWTHPHCWIQLVTDAPAPKQWSIEMGSPTAVFRGGWKPGTLKAGDRIEVTVHPARDGEAAGSFVSAVGPLGQPLGRAP
jgi:hypothetical protein